MYKLFLTIRYLTRKKIVVFPILVVWLCLMMMIIVTSIMGGFVDRVRETNREVLGDIIVSAEFGQSWPGYEGLETALKKEYPEIVAMTPVVRSHALANVPRTHQTLPVEVLGIDPVARSKVSRFRETLFKEYISPHEAGEDLRGRLPATGPELVKYAKDRVHAAEVEEDQANINLQAAAKSARSRALGGSVLGQLNYWWLLRLLAVAGIVYLIVRRRPGRTGWSVVWGAVFGLAGLAVVTLGLIWPVAFARELELAEDRMDRAVQAMARADRTLDFAVALPEGKYAAEGDILKEILPPEPSFAVPPGPPGEDRSSEGCIMGSQLVAKRDKRGGFDRVVDPENLQLLVTVFPASERTGLMSVNHSVTRQFTMVDDSYTGVFDIDGSALYMPFETAQIMAGMRADPELVKADPTSDFAPRCNELLIKLKPGTSVHEMKLIREKMTGLVESLESGGGAGGVNLGGVRMQVQTWDERQAKYLSAVENEKVMQTFILGLMSLVVLVVIFLIFYMIVRDKTRDIGIIKAIGGSEEGVAGIFLIYGLFIGVVGGIFGAVSGVAFVTHTNEIHEWIYQMTGIIIWDRSVYLFDRIPDTVHPWEVAGYFAAALLAGVIGALIPAIVAASEDPVKAVRYE